MEAKKVVFYDGDCGFCNHSVAFVLKRDKTKSIYFAPLQSAYCEELFRKNNWTTPDLSTFYFVENGSLFQKSTAALKVARYFSFPYNLLRIAWIVPRFLRDWVYGQIAKRRLRLSKGFCVMPGPTERARFLQL
ncbi:MAG: hypothetical protein A3D92_10635 [Bacteroidetes bacterium RIFCSPHIGHO2_02_FULL_44_7]|nr:MAG: hypothetical protein A3D92_10635 [Bacteroidetes bacterium RIFCSPHIGHO2_02_FULL_44_7]